jgi:hypothetical protein
VAAGDGVAPVAIAATLLMRGWKPERIIVASMAVNPGVYILKIGWAKG